MRLVPGSTLGVYEIVSQLGAGGMGEVYRARDPRLGRDIALKVLSASLADDPARLERFSREARAIAAFNHPHIVTIYSTEEAAGVRFLTMELLEGETLEALIRPGGLHVARFLDIAIPLADALTAAHQRQIVHRDLKPSNVMLTLDGRVKVLDFGLARVGGDEADAAAAATQSRLTHEGAIVGTMPYMSPEQLAGAAVDHRSDLFSLGTVFYEMLTGVRPFTGESPALLISAILRDTPVGVAAHRRDVPEPLARVIARCLEKQPDDRIQTARDVYNELRLVQRQLDPELMRAVAAAREPASVAAAPVAVEAPSIAVLPFADLSPAKDHDWFCDGIAEELLNALAQLPGLRVAARASSFSLGRSTGDLRSIGEKLNVTTVLEGSVRRSGDRVRITAQLSDVAGGFQLWSERYDRELRDIFDVQDEIARAIAERLRVTLSGTGRLVQPRTPNLEAYELLLKGRVLHTRRGRAIVEALACFERAIELDPDLAEAHALKGDALRVLALYGIAPATEMMPRAREAAERALSLDPGQVEAFATLASVAAVYDWDIARSVELSERALACDPGHVRTLAERAIYVVLLDAPPRDLERRAIRDLRRARELDPLNAWVVSLQAFCEAFTNRHEDAVASARQAVALDGRNFTARWALLWSLAWTGRYDEALPVADAALEMSERHPWILAELAGIHAARGNRHLAEAIAEELATRAATTYAGCAVQAAVAASAGRLHDAKALISRAVEARESYLVFWKLPAWSAMRADPEGLMLLRGTGIAEF